MNRRDINLRPCGIFRPSISVI